MSFNIALSGINAAQKDLDTTSNNIANVNTVGFKESRAEFADVYSNSLFTHVKTNAGSGVRTSNVAQQFHQGAMDYTNNALDLAINGSGFFVTSADQGDQDFSYTRAGAFRLDNDSYIVNAHGDYLRALPTDDDGKVQSVSLNTTKPVQLPQTTGEPTATSTIDMQMNLPANGQALDPRAFNPDDPDTYTSSTSVTIYDSLGESHIQTTYFVKLPYPEPGIDADGERVNNQWAVFTTVDGKPVSVDGNYQYEVEDTATSTKSMRARFDYDQNGDGNTTTHYGAVIEFDDTGLFVLPEGDYPFKTEALSNVINGGTNSGQTLSLDFGHPDRSDRLPTMFASPFEVTGLEQDGLTVGRLTNVEVNEDGIIWASYSNGMSQSMGKVAMARFDNDQGLGQAGSTAWKATSASGSAVIGEANIGSFGSINSAALEQSNVDLTNELVDLISAQRNFQANSRALDVSNQLSQNILQIR
ncbi:flagellar hook protein FlgE [Ferrimonas pelagia]|uniref:Flagellar hook protein FlgE n=1 Tax=Ferrimonas pelagia TaxID=1177826 RepID=A0ABP9F1C6_9GAMM